MNEIAQRQREIKKIFVRKDNAGEGFGIGNENDTVESALDRVEETFGSGRLKMVVGLYRGKRVIVADCYGPYAVEMDD